MRFPCKLEGGPFDGDQGCWEDREELPERFWVASCDGGWRCPFGGIHWFASAPDDGPSEVYVYDRNEVYDNVDIAIYIQPDLDLSGLPSISAREHEPVGS